MSFAPKLLLAARIAPDKPVGMRELAGERFILVRRPGAMGMYGDLIEAFRKAKVEPIIVAEVEQMLTNIALVAAGLGVSVVPASMVGIYEGLMVYRRLNPGLGLTAPLSLVSLAANQNAVLLRFPELAQASHPGTKRVPPRLKASRS